MEKAMTQSFDDVMDEALKMAVMYGNGFIRFANDPMGIQVSVVPIEDYKYLKINDAGLAEFVETEDE
jgi:hypothetical protein